MLAALGPERTNAIKTAVAGCVARAACYFHAVVALYSAIFLSVATAAHAQTHRLEIVGGLGGVAQYTRYEEPFWTQRLPALTGGRVSVTIAPFDRRGIQAQELLPLMRLGVIPYGSVLLTLAAADEPELNAMDLPGASPDLTALRRTVAQWRPHLEELLRERYGVELLAIYTHPAQVVFCRGAFRGLSDLAGRRVRVSSVSQSEFMAAIGATPVVLPFSETVAAMRSGAVHCAITGTLSGNTIGLHEVATHVSGQAISWGLSAFGANATSWAELPVDIRSEITSGLRGLEEEIWGAAAEESAEGLACNAGLAGCRNGRPGRMTIVEPRAVDADLSRHLLERSVVPAWTGRCGSACERAWARFGPAATTGAPRSADGQN